MKKLFESHKIKNTVIKNRICLPPLVVFTQCCGDEVDETRLKHYNAMAKGGVGLIIVEATCITEDGQLHKNQLGIWDNKHINGLKQLADEIHKEGAATVIQIHHAGVVGSESHLCPSAYKLDDNVTGTELTALQIEDLTAAYIGAAERAYKAGFDGVELHGCHSYLICQFLNKRVNTRQDIYGQIPEKFALDILEGIRKKTPADFIVGIRMGGFEPALEDGLRYAKVFEKAGFDFLDVSYGFNKEQDLYVPEGFPFKDVIYAAGEIKKTVGIPVFAVNSIRTGTQAKEVLELTNVDMVDVGRSQLSDYEWVNKIQTGKTPNKCLNCSDCKWFDDGSKCPAHIIADRRKINKQ